MMYQLKIE